MPSCSMVEDTGKTTSHTPMMVGFMKQSQAKLKSSFLSASYQRCGSAEIAVPTGFDET